MDQLEQRKASLLKELAEIEALQAKESKKVQRPVRVQEAAQRLILHLVNDKNVQTVGIVENNTEVYNKNPQNFNQLISEDSLIVYTYHKPTQEEQETTSFQGFKVQWIELGQIVPAHFSKKEK